MSVSVITPTYNRADRLIRALDSVASQTYDDVEHVVVDDGSTDATPTVVREYGSPDVRYIRFDRNRGANAARNEGIRAASGEYVTFLDSDDEYAPGRVERLVGKLSALSEEYGGVCNAFEIVEDGTVTAVNGCPSGEITLEDLADRNVIGTFSAVLFRSAVFEEVGLLDEEMPAAQDYEFYLRAARSFDFYGIDEPLTQYHRSADAISAGIGRRVEGQRRLRWKHGDILTERAIATQYYNRGRLRAASGDLGGARRDLLASIRLHPSRPVVYYYLALSLFGSRAVERGTALKHRLQSIVSG